MNTQIIITTVILTTLFATIFVILINHKFIKKDLHELDFRSIATQLMALVVWVAILANIILPQHETNYETSLIIFLVSVVIGIFLIRSLFREMKTEETVQKLISKLLQYNIRLKKLDKQKTDFLSLASHQLRGPLSIINGQASMILEKDYGEVPENLRGPLKIILESSDKLGLLINDYLNVSKIEKGQMEYKIENIKPKDLLEKVVNEYQILANRHKIELNFSCEQEENNNIKGDYIKLKQIFSNVIDNAIKYTKEGSVDVTCLEKNKKIIIKVKDTGIGISPEKKLEIFGKFIRSEEAVKMDVGGTGLGLFVAKIMTEAMDGKIWVESEGLGKGSTFFIEFPITK